jgi:hypothetical protein
MAAMVAMRDSSDEDDGGKEEEEADDARSSSSEVTAHKTVESMYQRVYGKALIDHDAK